MILKKLRKKEAIIFLFIFSMVLLSLPPIIRVINNDSALIGDQAYYNKRIANAIKENPKFSFDSLAYGGIDYVPQAYHYFLAYFSLFFSTQTLMLILPPILGILSLLLFYKILEKFNMKKEQRSISCILLLISPIFLYLFSIHHNHALPVFLNLLAFYLFFGKKKSRMMSYFIALLIPLFGLAHALTLFLSLLFGSRYRREYIPKFRISSFILFASSLFYYIPFFLNRGLPKTPEFLQINLFNSFIADFGATVSFSLFSITLALIGILLLRKEHQNLPFYIITLILFALSYYVIPLRFYVNFIIVLLSAKALMFLIKRKWRLSTIKQITILAIICGLAFSSISYAGQVIEMPPSQPLVKSMEWLRNQPSGKVISHHSNGFFIETIAKKQSFMNPNFNYVPNLEKKHKTSEMIFSSHRLLETSETLEENNIRYILITEEMKQGQVWEKDNQGILILLKNSIMFKEVYSLEGVEVWTYLGK